MIRPNKWSAKVISRIFLQLITWIPITSFHALALRLWQSAAKVSTLKSLRSPRLTESVVYPRKKEEEVLTLSAKDGAAGGGDEVGGMISSVPAAAGISTSKIPSGRAGNASSISDKASSIASAFFFRLHKLCLRVFVIPGSVGQSPGVWASSPAHDL